MSDLLQDDLPDDAAQSGRVESVGDPAQVEVNVRSCQEVDLDAANQRDVRDQRLENRNRGISVEGCFLIQVLG